MAFFSNDQIKADLGRFFNQHAAFCFIEVARTRNCAELRRWSKITFSAAFAFATTFATAKPRPRPPRAATAAVHPRARSPRGAVLGETKRIFPSSTYYRCRPSDQRADG